MNTGAVMLVRAPGAVFVSPLFTAQMTPRSVVWWVAGVGASAAANVPGPPLQVVTPGNTPVGGGVGRLEREIVFLYRSTSYFQVLLSTSMI